MTQPLSVTAITRKPDSPSFEQRVVRYVQPLGERGIEVRIEVLPKGWLRQRAFFRRLPRCDVIWWHRHLLNPLTLGGLTRRPEPVVFDFDDPLPFSARAGRVSRVRRFRFARLLLKCRAATAASEYLAGLARPCVADVHVIPMAAEAMAEIPRRPAERGRVTLLWLGSSATQPYLELIRRPLEELGGGVAQSPLVRLRLVAHAPMRFGSLPVDYRRWSVTEQEAALRECDIGLCPMPDTPWTRGKCSYKVLQYMGAGMAWIGSAVGENKVMACADSPNATGHIAPDSAGWSQALRSLVHDPALRQTMGEAGWRYITRDHAPAALADRLAGVFMQCAGRASSGSRWSMARRGSRGKSDAADRRSTP
ncbi:MAG: glycosyltransferase [Phycisphaeraceae bacterium]